MTHSFNLRDHEGMLQKTFTAGLNKVHSSGPSHTTSTLRRSFRMTPPFGSPASTNSLWLARHSVDHVLCIALHSPQLGLVSKIT